MNIVSATEVLDHPAQSSAYLFRDSDIIDNYNFTDMFKTFIHYNNRVAYIVSKSGAFSYQHNYHAVIVTLSSIKDLHWTLQNNFGEKFDAPAGSVLVIPQNTEYKITLPLEADYIHLVLDEEQLSHLQDITGGLMITELFPHASRLPNPKALVIANLLRSELLKNGPISSGYINALLSVFMVQLVQNHSFLRTGNTRQENGGLSYQSSRRIEAYLRENYMRKLSIEKMSDVLGISGGHFLTSFRESFGQTPHQFLLMLRLNAAEEMLIDTNIALVEIADRAGFSSQSHMTTALKKCRMITPGELRRKQTTSRKKI